MAKIIVSLSDELLKIIDSYCQEYKYNRSELVRQALRELLKRETKNDNTNKDIKSN